jgi:hypothetical protein
MLKVFAYHNLCGLKRRIYRDLAEGAIDAVLVAGHDKVNSRVALLRLLNRESNVVVKHFFNRSAGVRDFPGALVPLNCADSRVNRAIK